jgi:putative membrane protein
MKIFFLRLLVFAALFFIAPQILKGMYVDNFLSAALMALAFSFLHQFIKPLLILITIPVTCLTLGAFLLIINTLLLMMADYLVDGFRFSGFLPAFFFSLLLSLTDGVLRFLTSEG